MAAQVTQVVEALSAVGSLAGCRGGQRVRIREIGDIEGACRFRELGLYEGAEVTIVSPADPVVVKVFSNRVAVSRRCAGGVLVDTL